MVGLILVAFESILCGTILKKLINQLCMYHRAYINFPVKSSLTFFHVDMNTSNFEHLCLENYSNRIFFFFDFSNFPSWQIINALKSDLKAVTESNFEIPNITLRQEMQS